jgi:hypothetical protein
MSVPRALALLLPLLVAACRCGGKGDHESRRGVATHVSAADLYRDYSKLRGIELLEAYAGGVVVTGTVSQATELGEEGLQIWLALDRSDLGTEARRKGIRPGAPLRARCQVGGKPEDTLFLTACSLQ